MLITIELTLFSEMFSRHEFFLASTYSSNAISAIQNDVFMSNSPSLTFEALSPSFD